MALVSCPECQKEVSIHALACPQCGFPFPGKQASAVGGQLGTKLYACPDCGCAVSKKAQTCPHCGVVLIGEKRSLPTNSNSVNETWLCTHCGNPYIRKGRKEKEVVTDQEAVVPGSNTGQSVERVLEPVPQPKAVPGSNTGRSVERVLEPVPQPEAVPGSNMGQSVERLLEPAPQPKAVPGNNGGHSVGRPLRPIPNQVKRKKVSASPRRQSQLWQDSSFPTKIDRDVVSRRYPRSRKKSILLGLLVFILIAISVVSGAVWQLQGINPLEVLVYWRM